MIDLGVIRITKDEETELIKATIVTTNVPSNPLHLYDEFEAQSYKLNDVLYELADQVEDAATWA